MALLAIPLFLFLFTIINAGHVLWLQNALESSVTDAARCAAVNTSQCGTASQIKAYAADQSGAGFDSSVFSFAQTSCGKQVSATYALHVAGRSSAHPERAGVLPDAEDSPCRNRLSHDATTGGARPAARQRSIAALFGMLGADRRGAVMPLFALALPIIIGFAGLGTEVANWYLTKRTMQGAADAAASTAATALAAGTTTPRPCEQAQRASRHTTIS